MSTKGSEIWSYVEHFQISLLKKPYQEKPPKTPCMNKEEQKLVQTETNSMLMKGVMTLWDSQQPLPETFKKISSYQHLKVESLNSLSYVLQKGDLMYKLDLDDAYFSVSLQQNSQRSVLFACEGEAYAFVLVLTHRQAYLQN